MALVAVTAGATMVLGTGTPAAAAAQPVNVTLDQVSWSRADSKSAGETITSGDALVGAFRDAAGKHHNSKSYFTFDVSKFRGTKVFSARVRLSELAAADCAKPRATQLWVVEPSAPITWAAQPEETARLVGPTVPPWTGCTYDTHSWDAADAVRDAVAKGRSTLTVAARIDEAFAGDVAYARTLRSAGRLSVSYNTPPNTPTGLLIGQQGKACGPDLYLPERQPMVRGAVTDPDGYSGLDARFAFWPVDDPTQRKEVVTYAGFGSPAQSWFPADMVRDGGTYAWALRAEDGHAVSEWSAPCQFTADLTRPAHPPTVSSTTFREDAGPPGDGWQGVPGDFTFNANGDTDVVGFRYHGLGVPYGEVAADRPGGSATVSVMPSSNGPLYISVFAVDRVGNRSDSVDYRFWVRSNTPRVETTRAIIGQPFDATFTAVQEGAVAFTYRLDGQPETTVPVGPDGTATVRLQPAPGGDAWYYMLVVSTTNAKGTRSGTNNHHVFVDRAAPTIDAPFAELIGRPLDITFRPGIEGVTSYTYWINGGPRTVVAADSDGVAHITYTTTGETEIYVFSTFGDGFESGIATEYLYLDDGPPVVTSDIYPGWPASGGPGVPGTFRFDSPLDNVTEYRYTYDHGPEQTVAAHADGTASVVLTPDSPSYHAIDVYAVTSTGIVSGRTWYSFEVSPTATGPA